jgi:hypothetical protein
MESTVSENDRWIFGIFLRLYAGILCISLLDASQYIVAWCGERGVFPFGDLKQQQRTFFPKLTDRLLFWPSAWIPWTSNKALRAISSGAGVCALLYLVVGSPILLFVSGIIFVMLFEPCTLQWPWHVLSCEIFWILSVGSLGGYTELHPINVSLESVEAPSAALLLSLRFLLFRVLFGFGKLKFSGSTLSDRMYIRPFSSMLPILSFIGLAGYRRTPRVLFIVGYVGFFVGEIIVPFMFFFPQPYRTVAAVNTMLLMLGIQLSGNFGTFNALTAVLSVSLLASVPADASSFSWLTSSASSILVSMLLIVHGLCGLCLIPFNSWVSASWFFWPSIRRALPRASNLFEVLSMWRMCNGYGVFPPNVMSALRQIPVFEVSQDGKLWTALRYKYQPSQTADKARVIPLLHPILDFVVFYYVGYGGFMKTIFDCRTPLANFQSRPINAIARNLLRDGDVKHLFASESAAVLWNDKPKYVRVVQQAMLPLEQDEYESRGSCDEWKIVGGTEEVPAVTIADLDGPLLPPPFVQSLDDTDPCLTVWRRRSSTYQNQLRERNAAGIATELRTPTFAKAMREIVDAYDLSTKNKRNYSSSSSSAISKSDEGCDVNSAAELHDNILARYGSGFMNRLRWATQRAIYCRLQQLEDLHYFSSIPTAVATGPSPVDHFDLYLYAASNILLLATNTQAAADNSPTSVQVSGEEALNRGTFLLVFLFAGILRVEASIYRRAIDARCIVEKPDPEADKIVPGGARLVRALARRLRYLRGSHETRHRFVFNEKLLQYEYLGVASEAELSSWPWAPPK